MNIDVDELAQEIRRVDGQHKLGAGQLAEALMPFLSRRTAPAEPVAVKPLEWACLMSAREDGPPEPTGDIEAVTMIGEYSICIDDDAMQDGGPDWKWCAWTPVECLGHFGDLNEAKAAAQSDYEARIRSTLSTLRETTDDQT